MVMIREISSDILDTIDSFVNRFLEKSAEGQAPPPNFSELIKKSVSEGKATLYGAYSDDYLLLGLGMFGDVSKRISFVFADGDANLETKLVDVVFDNHSKDCSSVAAAGPWITEVISSHLIKIGFRKFDRAYMSLERADIESARQPELSKDMKIEIYNEEQRDEVSKILFKANDGLVDQIVFPHFFSTLETCNKVVSDIENSVYGEYKEPFSWILRNSGQIIGICLMSIRNSGDTGYIPYIVIDPDYQGKGLGRFLLIHSMKKIIDGEPDIVKVDLDVTLENDARFLYKSLGFKKLREYSMYTWVNDRE